MTTVPNLRGVSCPVNLVPRTVLLNVGAAFAHHHASMSLVVCTRRPAIEAQHLSAGIRRLAVGARHRGDDIRHPAVDTHRHSGRQAFQRAEQLQSVDQKGYFEDNL